MTTDEIEALLPAYAALGIPRGIALTMIIYARRRLREEREVRHAETLAHAADTSGGR